MKQPFVDLDALVEKGAEFKFKDHIYTLKPIDAETFMSFSNEWASLQMLVTQDLVSEEDSMNVCVQLIRSVCREIPAELIRKEMTLAQIGALINLIVNSVTGQVDSKKKVKMREPAFQH